MRLFDAGQSRFYNQLNRGEQNTEDEKDNAYRARNFGINI